VNLIDGVTGAADHLAGSVDESVSRQFDDEQGGGTFDFGGGGGSGNSGGSGQYSGDSNGVATFGDGSNRWLDGTVETISNPVDALTNPYDTAAGAADAAALNFDEGIGGLSTFFDDKPGNTAGPGQSPALTWFTGGERQPGQPKNPGTTGSPLIDRGVRVIGVVLALYLLVTVAGPALELGANVTE